MCVYTAVPTRNLNDLILHITTLCPSKTKLFRRCQLKLGDTIPIPGNYIVLFTYYLFLSQSFCVSFIRKSLPIHFLLVISVSPEIKVLFY